MSETRVDALWETGTPHDPRSLALYEALERIDLANNDYFCWKRGGDGDNGEELMYLLDIHFAEQDAVGGPSDGKKMYWSADSDEPVVANSISELADLESFDALDVYEVLVATAEPTVWVAMLPDGIDDEISFGHKEFAAEMEAREALADAKHRLGL